MAGEWPLMSLAEAGVALFDCDHRTPAEAREGLPYVTIPQMRNFEIDLASARRISPRDFDEWTRKTLPRADDVVLSRRCNPGETAFVRKGQRFALGQNLVLLRADGQHVLPEFLRWMARGPAWWGEVEKYRNPGAVFDSLKCADILKFDLPVPPLELQKPMAELLGAIDNKIALDRRVAETIQGIIQAQFKSWFVDFYPVRAKSEGRPTGLPDGIAMLFPDCFGEAGLPTGWMMRPVSDLFEISGGNTPSTQVMENWNGDHQWATPKDLSHLTSPVLLQTERKITAAGLARSTSGLLPAGSLLLSSRAPIGYMAFATKPVAINQGFAGFVAREVSTVYAWCWCAANMDVITGNAGGSTFPEISKSVLRQLPMLAPPQPVLTAFGHTVGVLLQRMVAAVEQAQTLAALRDGLLPRLISGEIRIGDARRAVEAA
jgi:type I restriction enzyme S subunit